MSSLGKFAPLAVVPLLCRDPTAECLVHTKWVLKKLDSVERGCHQVYWIITPAKFLIQVQKTWPSQIKRIFLLSRTFTLEIARPLWKVFGLSCFIDLSDAGGQLQLMTSRYSSASCCEFSETYVTRPLKALELKVRLALTNRNAGISSNSSALWLTSKSHFFRS